MSPQHPMYHGERTLSLKLILLWWLNTSQYEPCSELSDYPAIRLNKVTLHSVKPEALRHLGSKQSSHGTVLECDIAVSKVEY